ncbi:MAG: IPT/TIG domain-containing protein, partial [Spirochaetaceae bacterium]|nr:IPT/TIG domain-containing protein [Spirochaetaceae bacterium]
MRNNIFALSCFVILLCACTKEKPVITRLDPEIADTGDDITIYGEGFGSQRGESYVTIAGVKPTVSSYRKWAAGEITLRLPEFGDSGLIYVHKNNVKSNPVIFLASSGVPRAVHGTNPGRPSIITIKPNAGYAGQPITIQGNGFGETRKTRTAGVRFNTWNENSNGLPSPLFIQANESDYESWKEREIVVRIPDGAINGLVSVFTEKGESAPFPLNVRYQGGTKQIRGRRLYRLSYSVDIQVEESAGGDLYIWMPCPLTTPSQRLREINYNSAPFLENHHGLSLFKFSNLKSWEKRKLSVEATVESAAFETTLDPALASATPPSGYEKIYREESPLIPSNDAVIRAEAARLTGTESHPYRKARLIYNAITSGAYRITPEKTGGALNALQSKKADAYSAALLFCALCRASGISARPAAGILIDNENKGAPHSWAQFYLENYGWLPVDLALGAEKTLSDYYFGNLDSRHIVFSEGEV